jgi:hypothetical protein
MKFVKLALLGILFCSTSHAFISLAESGDVLPMGKYQVGLEPQLITSKDSGGNINVFFDAPINESTSARVSLGAGVVDFNSFASVKYMPFPDVDNQPAIGIRGGLGFTRLDDDNVLVLQAAPMVSKKFDTVYGMTVPYLALPFTFFNEKHDSFVASNLAIGSEFHSTEVKEINFGAELGLDLNKSWSYISIYASFPFDGSKGFGK